MIPERHQSTYDLLRTHEVDRRIGKMDAGLLSHAPILVLGLGNLLLQDDGVGLKLLEIIAAGADLDTRDLSGGLEFVDGGTQGLELLGYLDNRRLIVVLDAVGLGDAPGTVHMLCGDEVGTLRAHRSATAYEGNAIELLSTAQLLGTGLQDVVIIGIEPEHVRTGVGLSPPVAAAVPVAAAIARRIIASVGAQSVCA